MIHFAFVPAFILILPVIAYAVLKEIRPRARRAGIRFSSTRNAARVSRSLKQRLAFIPSVLRILGLLLIVFCLARPQLGVDKVRDVSRGIAIEMVVDHSTSMGYLRNEKGRWMNRLEIVKRVFANFVNGDRKDLEGRPNDLIGMISFARYPDTLAPLTLSHGALNRFIETLKLVERPQEDGTSIGDAIALAAARLTRAEETMKESLTTGENPVERSSYEIKSKVMILLSDGEDTGVGEYSPMKAAELARKWGVKIYTIIITGNGWFRQVEDIFGKRLEPQNYTVDTRDMENIAQMTGGIFRQVDDYDSLLDVYKEIDRLEKSEIISERYMDYKELYFIPGLVALALLALEMILNATIFRRIP